nr:transposase [Micromonospora arborensis]
MAETRRQFDPEFRAGAVCIVRETGKSIAQVARDLGINSGTLANWVKRNRETRGEGAVCRSFCGLAAIACRRSAGALADGAVGSSRFLLAEQITAPFGESVAEIVQRSAGDAVLGEVLRIEQGGFVRGRRRRRAGRNRGRRAARG